MDSEEHKTSHSDTRLLDNPHTLTVFHSLTQKFLTSHVMSAREALYQISDCLSMIALKDTPNMFVIEKDRTINVIRLTNLGKEQLPSERLELVGL